MKIKEISEKLLLQNQRAPNREGSNFFFKFGGVPIRRGLILAKSEGSQSGGASILPIRKGLIFANPEGYYFIKGLRQTKNKITVRGIRLLADRLGISDCTGNLPFNKDQTKTKQDRARIFVTLSLT